MCEQQEVAVADVVAVGSEEVSEAASLASVKFEDGSFLLPEVKEWSSFAPVDSKQCLQDAIAFKFRPGDIIVDCSTVLLTQLSSPAEVEYYEELLVDVEEYDGMKFVLLRERMQLITKNILCDVACQDNACQPTSYTYIMRDTVSSASDVPASLAEVCIDVTGRVVLSDLLTNQATVSHWMKDDEAQLQFQHLPPVTYIVPECSTHVVERCKSFDETVPLDLVNPLSKMSIAELILQSYQRRGRGRSGGFCEISAGGKFNRRDDASMTSAFKLRVILHAVHEGYLILREFIKRRFLKVDILDMRQGSLETHNSVDLQRDGVIIVEHLAEDIAYKPFTVAYTYCLLSRVCVDEGEVR